MFQVSICGRNPGGFTVEIDGCPEQGIEAVDFRRSCSLPDEPSNRIVIPHKIFTCESTARVIGQLNKNADYNLLYEKQFQLIVNGTPLETCIDRGYCLTVSPSAIRMWLADPSPTNAIALIRNIRDISCRNKSRHEQLLAAQRAEQEARERAMVEARKLLAPEIEKLTARVKELETQLNKGGGYPNNAGPKEDEDEEDDDYDDDDDDDDLDDNDDDDDE